LTGVIKNVNFERGFGFITGLDGIDYFFHRSNLADELAFSDLQEGDEVTLLEIANTDKGWRAVSVGVLQATP
jgi:cold shock CspA family protein